MARSIDYGKHMHRAMCSLIAEVMADVAENGLPGSHHFVISFDIDHPGVDLSDRVRQDYAKDGVLTIIMRNWFQNLAVTPDRFAVTLSFGGQPEPLVVPFDALKTFIDPSVEFGLRFDAYETQASGDEAEDAAPADGTPAAKPAAKPAATPSPTPSPTDASETEGSPASGQIVSLDTFRKH